ncbi:MAG: hypothetical protein ABI647_12985 [Gemmatimonadota bacterium]
MMDVLRLLTPVLWVIVSAIVGRWLYQTSEAFFEDVKASEGSKRTVRLVGSAMIAAVAFLGLRQATPRQNLEQIAAGSAILPPSALQQVREQLKELDRKALELQGCVAAAGSESCSSRVMAIRNIAASAVGAFESLQVVKP